MNLLHIVILSQLCTIHLGTYSHEVSPQRDPNVLCLGVPNIIHHYYRQKDLSEFSVCVTVPFLNSCSTLSPIP